MNQWLYFGCHRRSGHYLFVEGMRERYDRKLDRLTHFDGKLPPQDSAEPYIATVSRLEGWGMSALAFWDYSVDSRGGCNSIVFAPSLTIEPENLLAEAQTRFPEVFGRLPQAVRLLSPTRETTGSDQSGSGNMTALDEACYANEAAEKELEQLRAKAARWDAIEILMIVGDVELTQADDGGYRISVEPVESILPTSWDDNAPDQVADKVVAQLMLNNGAAPTSAMDLKPGGVN